MNTSISAYDATAPPRVLTICCNILPRSIQYSIDTYNLTVQQFNLRPHNIIVVPTSAVFSVDETSRFEGQAKKSLEARLGKPLIKEAYKCRPRPILQRLEVLRRLPENAAGCKSNFMVVNYYASRDDNVVCVNAPAVKRHLFV
jgi:hypothetical protein